MHGHHHGFSSKSPKKKFSFFLKFFFLKITAIGWIESRTKFQNSTIFIFLSYDHFSVIFWKKLPQFSMLTQKIKIGKLIFHLILHIAHLSSKRENWVKLRRGEFCISLGGNHLRGGQSPHKIFFDILSVGILSIRHYVPQPDNPASLRKQQNPEPPPPLPIKLKNNRK